MYGSNFSAPNCTQPVYNLPKFNLSGHINSPKTPSNVRSHHPSFRDFLSIRRDAQIRGSRSAKRRHRNLFSNCLDLMSKLQGDICNIQHPGILASTVEKDKVRKSLPPEIQYACRYWTHHLQQSNAVPCNDSKVHNFCENISFTGWRRSASLGFSPRGCMWS